MGCVSSLIWTRQLVTIVKEYIYLINNLLATRDFEPVQD